MLLGGEDGFFQPACLAHADVLRAKGAAVSVVVSPDACHGFNFKAAAFQSAAHDPSSLPGRD